jgi:excisionase family DNA binding protein
MCKELCDIVFMSQKTYTTQEAADAAQITRATLQAWIGKGKIKAPRTQLRNGRAVRLWSKAQIAELNRAKNQIYQEGHSRQMKRKR